MTKNRQRILVAPMMTLIVCLMASVLSQSVAAVDSTYGQVTTYPITGKTGTRLVTFTLASDGNIYALLGRGTTYGTVNPKDAEKQAEVVVINPGGDVTTRWDCPFEPQRIAVAKTGDVYVAGAGRLAKFSKTGELIDNSDLPHIKALFENKDELAIAAKEHGETLISQLNEQLEMFENALKTQKARNKKKGEASDDAKPADKKGDSNTDGESKPLRPQRAAVRIQARPVQPSIPTLIIRGIADALKAQNAANSTRTAKTTTVTPEGTIAKAELTILGDGDVTEEAADDDNDEIGDVEVDGDDDSGYSQLPAQFLEQQVKGLRERIAAEVKKPPEARMDELKLTLKGNSSVHSLHVDGDAIYYVARRSVGFGYCMWKTNTSLDSPQLLIAQLSGCCSQCDVHVRGNQFFVADNTKHRVSVYDSNGKLASFFGRSLRGGGEDGFGGCCNPMNLNFTPNGEILTAESEGIIKRFSADGKFEHVVGKSVLKEGCKHVPLAMSADAKYVFFLDLPGSKIVRLERGEQAEVSAGGAR